jgi:glutathionylspermidine synthase
MLSPLSWSVHADADALLRTRKERDAPAVASYLDKPARRVFYRRCGTGVKWYQRALAR